MTPARVLVAGEINADLVLGDLSSFPEVGREVLALASKLVLGSASAIAASGLARLGSSVLFLGKLGDDLFGRFCLEEMRRAGIDVGRVLVAPGEATGVTVAISASRDRALVTYPGTTASFSADEIPHDVFDGASHLHVSSFFLQRALRPGLPELFRRARRRGLTTSLDPGHDPEDEWTEGLAETLREVDVFLPNENELRATSGESDVEKAMRSFEETRVVVKLGPSGAATLDEDGSLIGVGAPSVNVVDTTGAGDSFDAGFLHAFVRREPLSSCLRHGVAAGSLSTRAFGGTAAQPSFAELRAFLSSSA